MRSFYKLPSVILLGPKFAGKSTLIRELTKKDAVPHYKEDDMHVGYLSNGKNIQFIEPQDFHPKNISVVRRMNRTNCKSMVYLFDVSKYSEPIESQIKNFRRSIKAMDGVDCILVANKMDIHDKKKVRLMRDEFDKVHEVSLYNRKGVDSLKNNLYSKFN